ncbi:RNA polymerase sigma factor [Bacteroidota bacterium]
MKDQSRESFLILYESVHEQLSRYCRAISGNRQSAEDLMHDTVLAAFESFEKIKNLDSFKYYLFGIARNLYKMRLRKEKIRVDIDAVEAKSITDHSRKPEQLTDFKIIYESILKLPQNMSETLILFYISDLSIEEIQKIQGVSISAVKQRLKRGREKLMQQLQTTRELKTVMMLLAL